jgi:hypothetical protein
MESEPFAFEEHEYQEEHENTPSFSASESDSAYEVQEGIRLHFSIDPLTAKTVVEVSDDSLLFCEEVAEYFR